MSTASPSSGLLWRFKEDDEDLLQLAHLPAKLSTQAALFYRRGNWDKWFHNRAIPPPRNGWERRSLPLEASGWALLFLDYPAVGAAFQRLIHLIVGTNMAGRCLLRPCLDGLAFACGSPNPHASDPTSALDSK